MAIALVRNSGTKTGTSSVTGEIEVTVAKGSVGNRWIIAISQASEKPPTEITDAASDIFKNDGEEHSGTAVSISIWSAEIKSTATTALKIKGLKALSVVEITVSEWSGIQNSGTYVRTNGEGKNGIGTKAEAGKLLEVPKITDLIFVAFGATSLTTFTPVSPYKELEGADQTGGSVGAEYDQEIESTAAPESTLSLTGTWVGQAVVYKSLQIQKTNTATISFIGTPQRQAITKLLAKIEFIRALPRLIFTLRKASISPIGSLPKIFEFLRIITASLTLTGKLSLIVKITRIASLSYLGVISKIKVRSQFKPILSFLGGLSYQIFHRLIGTISPSAILPRFIIRFINATLRLTGTVRRTIEQFVANLSLTGSSAHNITYILVAVLQVTGIFLRRIIHVFVATTKFLGTISYNIFHEIVAIISFVLSNVSGLRPHTGLFPGKGLYPHASTISRNTTHELMAFIPTSGILPRNVTYPFTAILTFFGILRLQILYTLTATIQLISNLPQTVIRTLMAVLTLFGSVRPIVIKNLKASLASIGIFQRRTTHELMAFIMFSTRLIDYIIYSLMAILAFTGTLPKRLELIKYFVANLTPKGIIQRLNTHSLRASVMISGISVVNYITHSFEAILGFTARLRKEISYQLSGALTISGNIINKIYHILAANVIFIGTIGRSLLYQLRAIVGLGGSISRRNIQHIFDSVLGFIGFLKEIIPPHPIPDILMIKPHNLSYIVLRRTEVGNVYGLVNHLEKYPEMEMQSIIAKRHILMANKS